MKNKIKNIANIQSGLFTRPALDGEIVYLQSKHFDENGTLSAELHPDLKPTPANKKHLLQPGDVLFAAKGSKNFATWYESKNLPAIASTSFFVIRVNNNFQDQILPEYLSWCLNNPNAQKILKQKAKGTAIVAITKSTLEELEIRIPDIKTQQIILAINKLRNTERELINKIENLKEQKIQQQIINGIK